MLTVAKIFLLLACAALGASYLCMNHDKWDAAMILIIVGGLSLAVSYSAFKARSKSAPTIIVRLRRRRRIFRIFF